MIKLTKIDALMITFTMLFILPQLLIAPENASTIYNGVYGIADTVVKALFGLIVIQLLSKKRQK